MADATKRMNYFDRQFLRAADFQDEQTYDLDRRRRHNRLLHTPGVAEGLQVTGNVGDASVSVAAGTAYDGLGQEIVLPGAQQLSVSSISGATATAYVTISYAEQASDPSTDPGVTGNNTRTSEVPALAVSSAPPTAPNLNILLAKVALANGKVAALPDDSVETSAGTVLPTDLGLRSLTLTNNTIAPAGYPKLTCDTANYAAVHNASLALDAQTEVVFQDNGQIRSFDQSHKVVFNRANNLMELHEFGDIVLMTGGTSPTEKMRVAASGNVGIGTNTARSALEVQTAGPGKLGPSVTLTNPSGGGGAAGSVDFNTYAPLATGTYNPSSRIEASDDSNFSNSIVFLTNKPGAASNGLLERMRITSDGHIKSPMWNAVQLLNAQPGPLPNTTAAFTSGGGILLIFASGSGYAATAGQQIGMEIFVDGVIKGFAKSFTNEIASHKAFTANALLVSGVAAGSHTVGLVAWNNTTTDGNDFFNVTVLELPI
jgi:hypothetical protein